MKRIKERYQPGKIEKKWQEVWQKNDLYKFHKLGEGEKYYNLVEFPYPSGDLHIGHWFTFTIPDVHARFMKMSGRNVFFPSGFDAFGLPAENAAIKRGINPKEWTLANIASMHVQYASMGTMIDWSHEVITCLPEYYRWNQWLFIKLWEKDLAYRGKALSNWCPSCQTVLANEAIESGKCWRCGTEVIQKEIEQWFLRITRYADQLVWPEKPKQHWPKSVRSAQNDWIGKSEGAKVEFLTDTGERISVFTTRPDTLYGCTFLVLSPEHPLVAKLTSVKQSQVVTAYVTEASKKTERVRKEEKEKTGVFLGTYAVHPLTQEKIPIWIADYVLQTYGTGAIMAVPAHDERDFAFATTYDLPIKAVINKSQGKKVYLGKGSLINSKSWNGLTYPDDLPRILTELKELGIAQPETTYHIRDWSISRQRYWGTPVPMIHCEKCGIQPVPLGDLPVELPEIKDYRPKGKPPLAGAKEWQQVKCPKCGGEAVRDLETLDGFFDSSWYMYRYLNPHLDSAPFSTEEAQVLMPVDTYFGGGEHTLGHTLYARFFTKFFKDLGIISFGEFAKRRIEHGIVLGPDGNKMSKSKGNVINPDDIVKDYGADATRMYLCFMTPYEGTSPWSTEAVSGVYRFLRRIWELSDKVSHVNIPRGDLVSMHKTIKKVGEDLASVKMNTAVATLMEWLNQLSRKEKVSYEEYKTMLLLIAPFAPFMSEELWQQMGFSKSNTHSIHSQKWPSYDKRYLRNEEITIVIQVNGKVRDTLMVTESEIVNQADIEAKALRLENVKKHLGDRSAKKVFYIKGKLLNFVN